MAPSAHAGRRPRAVSEASWSLADLRPMRAEKDALRAAADGGWESARRHRSDRVASSRDERCSFAFETRV